MKTKFKLLVILMLILLPLVLFGCQNKNNTNQTADKNTTDNSSKNDTDSDKDTDEYKIYSNARYNYSIKYPNIYQESIESDNGDGITFKSTDGKYTFVTWGANNISDSTGETLLNEVKERVSQINQDQYEDDFYSVEYEGGGEGSPVIFIESGFIRGDTIICYVISFPAEEKDKFTEINIDIVRELGASLAE